MTSFWRSQPDVLDNNRSTETLPESSDIVIIGAGYTGAATAYHCIEQSQSTGKEKPSIVILEARQACSGATGRNGEVTSLISSAFPKSLDLCGMEGESDLLITLLHNRRSPQTRCLQWHQHPSKRPRH